MTSSKLPTFVFITGLVVTLSITAFAGKKDSAKHLAVGTISSIDANQIVVTEKVKGKDQPVTFKLDSSTQKSGNLQSGTLVTIQYRTEGNQNIATSVRERVSSPVEKKSLSKTK